MWRGLLELQVLLKVFEANYIKSYQAPLKVAGHAYWCPGPESNRYGLRRGILSPLCLPISPPGHANCAYEISRGGKPRRDTGGATRNRTEVHGFAGRCITTLPSRRNFQLLLPVRRVLGRESLKRLKRGAILSKQPLSVQLGVQPKLGFAQRISPAIGRFI